MFILKLFAKDMLPYIVTKFDNSHFYDSGVLLYARMFLRTVLRKWTQKHLYDWAVIFSAS